MCRVRVVISYTHTDDSDTWLGLVPVVQCDYLWVYFNTSYIYINIKYT